ncbi:unnamed protein product [Protopolystoma xenopodis]|uniref:Uncharacterized protein n=1 Tax=Protopolystoma xenopodis TaxID=117903 RepID=A0A3S5A6K5_9PLAT|nr:unnamed protein product [Protopolystoma xenopodis]
MRATASSSLAVLEPSGSHCPRGEICAGIKSNKHTNIHLHIRLALLDRVPAMTSLFALLYTSSRLDASSDSAPVHPIDSWPRRIDML